MVAAKQIDSLTGVRALAAFLVFFSHFPVNQSTFGSFFNGVLAQGYIGVTLFYVLSGFLIAYVYAENISSNLCCAFLNYKRYISKRFARIYPVYLLTLLFTIGILFYRHAFMQLHIGQSFLAWLFLQLTLLKGCFTQTVFSGVPQAWSLTVEFTFYLLAPFILVMLKSRYKWWVVPLCYLLGSELLLLGMHLNWHGFFGSFRFVVLYTFFGRAFEFILGAMLAINLKKLNRFDCFKYKTLIGFLAIFVIQMGLYLCQGDYRFGCYSPIGMLINNGVLPLFVALFFLGLINENTWIKQFFSSRIMCMLGRASYVFYLFQFLVMGFLLNDFSFRIAKPHSIGLVLTGFVLLNLVSIGIYYFYEVPMHRKFLRLNHESLS